MNPCFFSSFRMIYIIQINQTYLQATRKQWRTNSKGRIMKGKLLKLFILAAVIMQIGAVRAQTHSVSTERYYATSIYNFTRFVKWPDSQTNQDFKIAVVGSETVYAELQKLVAKRKYGQHGFQISYYKKHSEVQGYHHMVFLSTMNSGKIKSIKEQTNSKYTMYITERQSMGAFGSAISFYVDDSGRITFELSKDNFDDQELVLNSSLLSLAGKVSN